VPALLSAFLIARGNMFQYRSSDFGPSVAAIQKHLGAVEKELERIGRIAGRQTSDVTAKASHQIGDAISTILSEMVDRFRRSGQTASNQAGRLSNQALDLGTKYGNDALARIASETEQRPLFAIGVALGIGILIGAAVLGSASASGGGSSSSRRRR
jgi:ElaB/YqjD/DUF883 family membrane-anchored ribosome-binding protein